MIYGKFGNDRGIPSTGTHHKFMRPVGRKGWLSPLAWGANPPRFCFRQHWKTKKTILDSLVSFLCIHVCLGFPCTSQALLPCTKHTVLLQSDARLQVQTILSQNTTDTNSHRTFANLKADFKDWEEVRTAQSGTGIEIGSPASTPACYHFTSSHTLRNPLIFRHIEMCRPRFHM